jgi:5-methylthioadenosine/S-adenosylhomocysteine deaminase
MGPRELSLFADRCILGGIDQPLRITSARLDLAGTRIAAITEMARDALVAQPPERAVLDLGDRLVAPAFVNGHTHLAMSAFRGLQGVSSLTGNVIEDLYFALESGLSPSDVLAFSRMGAYESLLSGVGTVFDHYYHGQACAEALAEVGLTGVVAPTLQDLAGPGAAQFDAQLSATTTIDESSRLAARGVFAALGPHATDTVSVELWRRAVALGEQRNLPLHAHVAQSFDELTRCHERHGTTPIEWLAREGLLSTTVRSLLVHVIYATRDDLSQLSPDHHTLGFCPFSQVEFCFPAKVGDWHEAGLRWLIGTDCAPSNDSMDVQKELRLASGLHAFEVTFSSAQALFHRRGGAGSAASLDGLRRATLKRSGDLRASGFLLDHVWAVPGAWHPGLPCGALEPGRWANLLVLDPNHPALWPAPDPLRALAMSHVAPAIESMIVAGRFIGEPGHFQESVRSAVEYREARREADARLQAHRKRLGL